MTTNPSPPDWRGLCEELADSIELLLEMRPVDAKPLNITEERYARARAALAQPEPEVVGPTDEELPPRVGNILRLAEIIREVDGNHSLGAAALAEAILSHPGSRWGRPAPAPAGEVGELVARLRYAKRNGNSIPSKVHWDLTDGTTHYASIYVGSDHADDCDRAADLLERQAVTEESSATAPAQAPAGEVGEFADVLRDRAARLRATGFAVTAGEIERAADLLERQAAPAPAGEAAELAALIRQIAMAWAPDTCLLGNMTAGQLTRAAELLEQRQVTPVPTGECPACEGTPRPGNQPCAVCGRHAPVVDGAEVAELVWWLRSLEDASVWFETGSPEARRLARAADLLECQAAPVPVLPEDAQVIEPAKHTILVPVPVPVAVSERLPGAGDCDAEGRVWWYDPSDGWILLKVGGPWAWGDITHWLPARALPLPSGEVE